MEGGGQRSRTQSLSAHRTHVPGALKFATSTALQADAASDREAELAHLAAPPLAVGVLAVTGFQPHRSTGQTASSNRNEQTNQTLREA